jgi:Domain of unknown function (DUF6378)
MGGGVIFRLDKYATAHTTEKHCPGCCKNFKLHPGQSIYCKRGRYCTLWRMTVAEQRDLLLVEREKTHGSFEKNAGIFAAMCRLGRKPDNNVHEAALCMIFMKIARILSGQANFKDHWDDIAGYAKLGAEACE